MRLDCELRYLQVLVKTRMQVHILLFSKIGLRFVILHVVKLI
jgi:serine acetyltransferase